MGRVFSAGSGGIDQTILPANTIINVGPTRALTTIGAAVASLAGKYCLGSITIQLDDGTYNETTLTLVDPNLSGKLTITGDLANPSACVINFTDQFSQGFQVGNGFVLSIGGGMTINGMFNPTTSQYTTCIFTAYNNGVIQINNADKIVVNNSIRCFFAIGGKIFVAGNGSKNLTANNVFQGVVLDAQGLISGFYITYNATAQNKLVINDANTAGQFYQFAPTFPYTAYSIAVYTGQNCEVSTAFTSVNGFYNGMQATNHSNIYAMGSTFNNIAGTALSSVDTSFMDGIGCSFTNCKQVVFCGTANVVIDNPVAITGCTNLAYAQNLGYISAYGTSGFSVSNTKYNPPTSGVAGNAGAIINYS